MAKKKGATLLQVDRGVWGSEPPSSPLAYSEVLFGTDPNGIFGTAIIGTGPDRIFMERMATWTGLDRPGTYNPCLTLFNCLEVSFLLFNCLEFLFYSV